MTTDNLCLRKAQLNIFKLLQCGLMYESLILDGLVLLPVPC
jgi:hypothetical protein